jgi:N-acetylneuraminic acid mutarotase
MPSLKAVIIGTFLVLSLFSTTLVNPVHSAGDQWSVKKPMVGARVYSGAATLNGRIYVVGGIDSSLHVLSANYVYDSVSDTWASLAPLPLPTEALGLVSLDGRIYSIGGFSQLGSTYYSLTGSVEVYDPQSNNWTSRTPLPRPIEGLMVATVDGLIYAMGGTGAGQNENSTWVYNPQNDTWRPRAAMPTYDSSLAQVPGQVAVVGGKIYIFDQSEGSIGPGRPNDPKPMFNLVYDVATDAWAHWPALLATGARGNPISLAGDSMVAIGTKILVIGGNDIGLWCTGQCSIHPDPSPISQYNFEYDTVTGRWTRRTDMPTGRAGLVTVNVGGIVYAIGGVTSNANSPHPLTTGYTDHNEAYTPCSEFCAPFQPSSAAPYLTWAVEGIAAAAVAGIGLIVWRIWRKRRQRPPIRPLDPLNWRTRSHQSIAI